MSKYVKLLCFIIILSVFGEVKAQYGFGVNQPNQQAIVHIVSQDSTKGLIIPIVNTGAIAPDPSISGMIVYDVIDSCVKMCNGVAWFCLVDENNSGLSDNQNLNVLNGAANTSIIDIENGDSIIVQAGAGLSISESGSSITLVNTGDRDSTDDFVSTFDINAGNIRLVDGGGTRTIPISSINTDAQTLNVTNSGTTQVITISGSGDSFRLLQGSNISLSRSGQDITIAGAGAAGDITDVIAGDGLVGGATSGSATLNVVATNGLTDNANDIVLGGTLTQATTITQGTNNMTFNMNGTGDFALTDGATPRLQVQDDGLITSIGTFGSGNTLTTSGGGTRMIWYPRKAAFRVGAVGGSEWDNANVGDYSFVGGGWSARVNGDYSASAGGEFTILSGNYSFAGAGAYNTVAGNLSSVITGLRNSASGDYSFIGGGQDNKVISDYSFIGGGQNDSANGGYSFAGGGYYNTAEGDYSFVGAGAYNRSVGNVSSIVGGENNTASGSNSFVGGGLAGNSAGDYSFVGGGQNDTAFGEYSFVGGGYYNTLNGNNSFLGAGAYNDLNAISSFLGGGEYNTVNGVASFLGGGEYNNADGTHSVVGGGFSDSANGDYSFVGGGERNKAVGTHAVVTGGFSNHALGGYSFIAGGYNNTIASGHTGSVILGASATTTASDQLMAKFTNGYRLETNSAGTSGVFMNGGVSGWTNISDLRLKENIKDLPYGLETVMKFRPTWYNYKGNNFRSLGFIAQEMEELVPEVVHQDSSENHYKGIVYMELVPVLTKAIQEQNETIEDQQAELESQSKRLDAIQKELKELKDLNSRLLQKFKEDN